MANGVAKDGMEDVYGTLVYGLFFSIFCESLRDIITITDIFQANPLFVDGISHDYVYTILVKTHEAVFIVSDKDDGFS